MSINKYFILIAACALLLMGARTLTDSESITWDETTPGECFFLQVRNTSGTANIDIASMSLLVQALEKM